MGQESIQRGEETQRAKQIPQYRTVFSQAGLLGQKLGVGPFLLVLGFGRINDDSRDANTMLSPWQQWIYSVRKSRWGRK